MNVKESEVDSAQGLKVSITVGKPTLLLIPGVPLVTSAGIEHAGLAYRAQSSKTYRKIWKNNIWRKILHSRIQTFSDLSTPCIALIPNLVHSIPR